MSYKSSINLVLIICKLLAITYVPRNINGPITFVDYMYPLPIIISFILISVHAVKSFIPLETNIVDKEIVYSMWLFFAQCYVTTIVKWIYCIVQRNKFKKVMINLNEISTEFQNVDVIRNTQNYIIRLIFVLCIIFNYVLNVYFLTIDVIVCVICLPVEIANVEQYFIYNINKKLYFILNYINNRLLSYNINTIHDGFNKIKRTYDDYKKIVLLSEEINENVGFSVLCSLFVTFTALINSCYQIKILDNMLLFYVNFYYIVIMSIRLYFTIHSWNMLIIQVS